MTKALCIAVALLYGCATQPHNVGAQYVSAGRYDSYDCPRLYREAEELSARIASVSAILKSKADQDAGLVAVGVLLFWPALLFLPATGGKVEEAELGRIKGEAEAVAKSIRERCSAKAAG